MPTATPTTSSRARWRSAARAIGRLDTDSLPDVTAPTAGLTRLIDILGSDLQLPNDDHLMAWNGSSGNALPGFPQTTADLGFFVTPAIADLDGDGHNETIAGNGVYTVSAFDSTGARPRGWPKLTGGWLVGTPGLGDWDGDGRAELAVVSRDGDVFVWRTHARADALTEWPRSGGNGTNSAAYTQAHRGGIDARPTPRSQSGAGDGELGSWVVLPSLEK